MGEFCNRECEHLVPTEAEQDSLKRKGNHACIKYNRFVHHYNAHPKLYKCKECVGEHDI